jgi:hypothetical protein
MSEDLVWYGLFVGWCLVILCGAFVFGRWLRDREN